MRIVIALLLCVVLMTTVAFAGEKTTDTDNASPVTTVRDTWTGSLTSTSPVWDRIFGGAVSLECASNVSDSSQDGEYFELFCVEVTDSSPIEIIMDPALTDITDTIIMLYCEPFDAANPAANVVSVDDDGGEGLLSAFTVADNITLTPGNTYWLVVSTFYSATEGNFGLQTSDNVVDCGSVALEQTTFGALKANYR